MIRGDVVDYIAYDKQCGPPYDDIEYVNELSTGFDCDRDCRDTGTRFSHVLISNGVLMMLIMVNFICVGIGNFYTVCRMVGALTALCLAFTHFIILLATAVYRLRTFGLICAESMTPTYLSQAGKTATDGWTMKKDADLILALWIMQLFFCCCTCFYCALMPIFPIRQHEVIKQFAKHDGDDTVRVNQRPKIFEEHDQLEVIDFHA